MSGTEFAAGKLMQLQLTLSYLLQSLNFQHVYSVPAILSLFNICMVVLFWDGLQLSSSIQLYLCSGLVNFPFQVIFSGGNRKSCMGVGYGKTDREPLECYAWQELPDMQSIWAQYIVQVQK
jgi:hypothetical protein